MKLLITASLAGTLLCGGAVAWAQSEGEPELEAGAEGESRTPVAPISPSQELLQASLDESIYVVQRRAYSKRGKFELTPSLFTSLNNKFVGHMGLGLSAAYHVRENFAAELTTSVPYLFYGFYSGLVYEVHALNLAPEVVDLKQMRYFGSVSVQFSALYGKLSFWDHLIDYDFYLTAGTGIAKTVESCVPPVGTSGDPECSEALDNYGRGLKTPSDAADAWKIAGNLGGGVRVFFSDRLGLRVEVRDLVYADRAAEANLVTTDIRNNVIFFLGLSLLI